MQTMVNSPTPLSLGDVTTQFHSSNQTPLHTTAIPFNIEDYLESKNIQFVAALVPTLCYIALGVPFGLTGNTLVFMVYYKRFKPSVTRTYILAMSVCDLMHNVLTLPADIVEIRFINTFEDRWLCKFFRTVKSLISSMSAVLLVAVAFDRQRAICNPESNPTTVKHAVVVLVECSVLAVVFTAPYVVLTGPGLVHYVDSNITGLECSIDDQYASSRFLFIYNVISNVLTALCFVLMLGSYVRIARELWLHKKNTTIIMNSAAGKHKTKVGVRHSHALAFEDGSSGGTHSSSVNSQQSTKARNDVSKTDSAVISQHAPVHEETLKDSRTKPTQNHVENMTRISSSPSKDLVYDISSRTTNSDTEISYCDQIVSNTENRQRRNDFHPASANNRAVSGGVKVHNNGGISSAQEQRAGASSGSRAGLSQTRQVAHNSKGFVSRDKSTAKPHGSVRKIPNRTTFMMFVLTVVFIVNYLPYIALVTARSRQGEPALIEALGINGYCIGLRSYFINSVINPLVYSFCSIRFRQECIQLFKCNSK